MTIATYPLAGRIQELTHVVNPRNPLFGAIGDGVADDTAAIQGALDVAAAMSLGNNINAGIELPHGAYRFSHLDWGRCHFLGDGPARTRLIYDGEEGGTAITRTSTNNLQLHGVEFTEGDNLPATWVDCYNSGFGDNATDYGDSFEDVYFGNATGSSLKTATTINLHLKRIRWGACQHGIELLGGGQLRVVNIDDFTIDFSAQATHKGLVKFVSQNNTATQFIRIANGRYEGTSAMLGPASLVNVSSNPADALNTAPVKLLLENVAVQIAGTQTESISVIHQDTTQTNVLCQILALNSGLSGLSTWFSGSLPSWYEIPTWPGIGRVMFAAVGELATGTSPAISVQLQRLQVVSQLDIEQFMDFKERSSAPSAPNPGYLRIYAQGGSLRTKNSAGSVTVLT